MLNIHQITRCIYVHICIHTRIPKIIYIVIKCSFWHLNVQLILVSLLAEPVKTNARPEVRESRVVSAFSSLYPLSHPHLPPPSFHSLCTHTLSPSINPPSDVLHQWRPFLISFTQMLYLRNPAPSYSPTGANKDYSSLIWLVSTVNLRRTDGGLESPV